MKALYFICHDEQCLDSEDALPLIAIFVLERDNEPEDVTIAFTQYLREGAPPEEDCPVFRYAAEKVCKEFGCSVTFREADQVFGV